MSIVFILFLIVYQFIQILILPTLPIYLLIRKIKKKPVFGSLKERFGFVPIVNIKNKNIIWIHAVSVGEILSIQNLIDRIKESNPNSICYVTTGTITGKQIAQKSLNTEYISFLPYDFLITMLIAFKRIKPKHLIIVEAETWPNLIAISSFLKVNILLINARISKRSEGKYFKLKFIFKEIFNLFNMILTQTEKDKLNFEKLGVNKDKITVLGNIKILNVIRKKHLILTQKKTKQLHSQENKKYKTLLAGSTHHGELDIYLNLFKKLKSDEPNLKLIIAPRHFHWKKDLINKIKKEKLSFFLWDTNSEKQKIKKSSNIDLVNNLKESISTIFNSNDILIVCKLGEMFKLYQFCDIFLLGGTFVPIGGHNLLEPAVWSKPSIVGPHYQNTKEIALELEKENGIIIIKNKKNKNIEKELYLKAREITIKNKLAIQMGINSFNWIKAEGKKVEKSLNKLIQFIK